MALLATPASHAQSIYSEQDKLIRGGQAIGTLGVDLFGDKVNLYNGTLEFTQTDVSLPGNNALPVSVGRRLVAGSEIRTPGIFADWDLDIPHLHGVFSAGPQGPNLPWTTQNGGIARCSTYGAPPVVSSQGGGTWNPDEYWHGNFIYIPGMGSQEILSRAGTSNTNVPTDGNTWPLVTRSLWSFRCLPAPMARGSGEGFLAIAPDGTQYRFDWLVSRTYPAITKPGPLPEGLVAGPSGAARVAGRSFIEASMVGVRPGITPNVISGYGLTRQEVWIMPTVVTDRYGNTVTYGYNAAKPWQVTTIASSDGRTITLGYDATSGLVTSVNDGSRSWSYTYGSDLAGKRLDRVTQPDLAYWSYSMGSFTSSRPMYLGSPFCDTEGDVNTLTETGSMTHPSGATGTFVIKPTSHGRSFVERSCRGIPADGDYAVYPRFIASRSLVSKALRDPGQPADWVWSYVYSAAVNAASWLGCTVNCLDYKTVEVTDPRGVLTRYTFGNRFRVTEGQLQKVEVGPVGGAPLRTTTTHYRAPDAGPYSSYIGISPQKRGNGELAGRNTPADQRVITQQSVNFIWQTDPNSFDVMARPHTVTRSSSLGARTETTTFADNLSKWVLGQTDNVTEASTGKQVVKNNYDANANLLNTSRFGQLQNSFTYNGDGTLQTRSDGMVHTATFSNYKRGLAQNALYADGRTESAVVESRGLISSVTDANNFTTSYGYDIMGRLNLITRPTADTVTWNVTSLLFEPVGVAEYDIPAGHWRQTISTGNARTVTYFDAFWRPRLTRTFDALDEGNTRTMVQRNFDVDGRTVYQSYPARTITSVNAPPAGTRTTYEPLGRSATQVADSELGALTSYSYYDPAFVSRSVNPRGFTTTTSFQAFDEPNESAISRVVAPEGVTVDINRDVFSKSKSITRSGGGLSATRAYVYDIRERLCKTVEPEIGATIQDYDGASNVIWRASGLGLTSTTTCDTASVPPANKVSYAYDTRNRLTSTSFGDGSPSITRSYMPDGLPYQVASNGSLWGYEYNKRRLLTREILSYGSSIWTVIRDYNANGHASQMTYPDSAVVTFAPNALGLATGVSGYINANTVSYHPNGAVAGYTLGNGIVHSLTQNTRGLPLVNRDAGVMQDQYGFDANGNVSAITDQQEGVSTRTMGNPTDYDGLDRLKNVSAPGMWGTATYTYDALDNIRTSVVGARNSVHNYNTSTNRLDTINTNGVFTGYAYDNQGNITGRGTQGLYFDQGNRMQLANGKATYTYDGLGRRIVTSATDGTYRLQMYSQAGQLLFSQQQQGMLVSNTRYVYLGGKEIAETNSATGTSYAHTDALGSPVARTNSSAGLLTRTRYEPYGNTAAGTIPNGIGFAGHVNDPDTGLVYMQQRYYDPMGARFMSLDPVTTDANTGKSFNRYDYAANNPYKYRDPDGRSICGTYFCEVWSADGSYPDSWGVSNVRFGLTGTTNSGSAGGGSSTEFDSALQETWKRLKQIPEIAQIERLSGSLTVKTTTGNTGYEDSNKTIFVNPRILLMEYRTAAPSEWDRLSSESYDLLDSRRPSYQGFNLVRVLAHEAFHATQGSGSDYVLNREAYEGPALRFENIFMYKYYGEPYRREWGDAYVRKIEK